MGNDGQFNDGIAAGAELTKKRRPPHRDRKMIARGGLTGRSVAVNGLPPQPRRDTNKPWT
jgi:hypothetical protein